MGIVANSSNLKRGCEGGGMVPHDLSQHSAQGLDSADKKGAGDGSGGLTGHHLEQFHQNGGRCPQAGGAGLCVFLKQGCQTVLHPLLPRGT